MIAGFCRHIWRSEKDQEISREKIDGINPEPENEKTISVEKCQSEPNPTPTTPSAQDKGFSPRSGVSALCCGYFRLLPVLQEF